ncbi:MAG: hypothetical protein ACFFB0_11010 [Promethearchaeota archaeon]
MEYISDISSLEIPTNKISYNKKSHVLSVEILEFMFVGIYKKSTRISKILDDIYASLGEIHINRNDISFVDYYTNIKISETDKLKHLKLVEKEKIEKEDKKLVDKRKFEEEEIEDLFEVEEELIDEDRARMTSAVDDAEFTAIKYEEEKVVKRDEMEKKEIVREKEVTKAKKKRAEIPPPAPPAGGAAPARKAPFPPSEAPKAEPTTTEAPPPPPSDILAGPKAPAASEPVSSIIAPEEEPQLSVYEINMGLQYYSVMMEQRSYLFYVYFSHKELKIVDEEGKTIYETTIKIVTKKAEPPVLDLKIEGEGFEVHPIFGKVEVKKDAVNPPVMIFSIMPLKSKKEKKKKKESERRFLNVYIEFEEKIISHTILSIIVQPKYFRLELGPIHLNLSKRTATIISFISILIAGVSLVYTSLSIDPSSTFMDLLSGFAPGLGSITFIAIFLVTLFKEGIYPLKEKISAFLNFDQAGVLIK